MKINISHSLIKDMEDYLEGRFCGLLFKERHVLRNPDAWADSDAFRLGHWVEYMIAGGKPRDGHIPTPKLLKSAKNADFWTSVEIPNPNEDPTIPEVLMELIPGLDATYRRMIPHIAAFRQAFNHFNYTLIGTSVEWVAFTQKGVRVKGILDYIVEDEDGKPRIIDQKTSAYIDNKWEEMGWHTERLHTRHKIMGQPIIYTWLGWKQFGEIIPFEFWVASTKDSITRRVHPIKVSEQTLKEFDGENKGASKPDFIMDMIRYTDGVTGWNPKPSPERCGGCPLKETCELAREIPTPFTITI